MDGEENTLFRWYVWSKVTISVYRWAIRKAIDGWVVNERGSKEEENQ